MAEACVAPARRRKRLGRAAALAALSVVAALAAGCAQPQSGRVAVPSFAPLVQAVLPAVVNVSAIQRPNRAALAEPDMPTAQRLAAQTRSPRATLDEMLRRFFEQEQKRGGPSAPGLALGSGFVIDPRGYVVTDDHVLENADAVTVTFNDMSQHTARIIGRDAMTDLALLKIDAAGPLPYVRWGDSDAVRVGDWVLAIGNPFGLDDTVSSGIVSARGRDIHAGPYDDFLQIDASINRGNSGGPTFNLDGAVIGINTAIYSPNGGSVGIGFAIPANLARPVVEQLEQHGRVRRGWLGVQIQEVTPEIARSFGLARLGGALVAGVSPGGPAARAGFEQGDVILKVDRRDVARMRDLPLIVAETPIGEPAEVVVWRQGREIGLRPVIGEMPQTSAVAALEPSAGRERATTAAQLGTGLKLAPLTRDRRRQLRLGGQVDGVVVTEIDRTNPLAAFDILPGDVIETINRERVATPAEAFARLAAAGSAKNRDVLLLINRHGTSHFLAVPLSGMDNGVGG
ncbi:MAG TPA: Do family serine endopeptidase [Stellaceae bacterium]